MKVDKYFKKHKPQKTILKSILFTFWLLVMILSIFIDSGISMVVHFAKFIRNAIISVRYVILAWFTDIIQEKHDKLVQYLGKETIRCCVNFVTIENVKFCEYLKNKYGECNEN